MPELPDVLAYLHALEPRVVGRRVQRLRIVSPFVLRTFDPSPEVVQGATVVALRRLGKRIVFELGAPHGNAGPPADAAREAPHFHAGLGENEPLFLVVHLMIAGRFRWVDQPGAKPPGKIGLASLHFDHGTLHLVESSKKKRASLHLVRGKPALRAFDRGGVDVLACTTADFTQRLRSENHTLKRALTDPRHFDGIGNAYSDEILHAAQLSPLKWTSRLTDDEAARLHDATRRVLTHWIDTLRKKFDTRFPGPRDITAFRPGFAVHGRFGEACPVCGTPVQRIVYAENEVNYCPRCQTGGKLLADRSLSRLLHDDWPKTIEELE